MANPPPPYDNITGISRAVMKDNAQETIGDYNGVARPSELVVNQLTQDIYVGNVNGNLNLVAYGSGVTSTTTFNSQFTDGSGTFAGGTTTASFVRMGPLMFIHVYVDFTGVTNFGSTGYQITLPTPALYTFRLAGGSLHQTAGSGAPALYHIAGIIDVVDSTTVMKLYYSGSTTDLVWKFNTPGAGAWQSGAHFDLSGTYQVA
jgi:hypothetical protein